MFLLTYKVIKSSISTLLKLSIAKLFLYINHFPYVLVIALNQSSSLCSHNIICILYLKVQIIFPTDVWLKNVIQNKRTFFQEKVIKPNNTCIHPQSVCSQAVYYKEIGFF